MNLEIITHEALPLRHGFFTRKGGVSSGVFEGLNCGRGSSDQSEAVDINRGRVAAAMDVDPGALVSVHQVHSPDVVTVTAPLKQRPRADAMVTATPGLALGVLTADCGPVLFADGEAGVAGAAHAGWGGALAGVLEATVAAMLALGARREGIRAVLGPTIGPDDYEVGPEFAARFVAEDPANAARFREGRGDRFLFDLPGYILGRLRAAGIAAEWTGHSTYADEDRFFSYRRSVHRREADYGRLVSAIRV
ncbi:MAG: peptidoglycan editing factor PgeF [Hasllibacter sp.]